jgi:hypothetical protein
MTGSLEAYCSFFIARDACEPFDGSMRRARSDSRRRHRLSDFATECGGLEDPPSDRTIGIASRLAAGLPGTIGGTPRAPVSSVAAVWSGSFSQRHLHRFNKFFLLRRGETRDQPNETR